MSLLARRILRSLRRPESDEFEIDMSDLARCRSVVTVCLIAVMLIGSGEIRTRKRPFRNAARAQDGVERLWAKRPTSPDQAVVLANSSYRSGLPRERGEPSELIIPGTHFSQQTPKVTGELERILHEHLADNP